MQKRLKKGLKPFVIKYLALFIGLSYLANPLQEQIRTVFHEISHALEAPDTVVSHKSHAEYHNDAHHSHEHTSSTTNHDHTLIDFLDSIFDASNTNDHSDESLLVDIKFDKHLSVKEYSSKRGSVLPIRSSFSSWSQKTKTGHPILLKEPPQNFSLQIAEA